MPGVCARLIHTADEHRYGHVNFYTTNTIKFTITLNVLYCCEWKPFNLCLFCAMVICASAVSWPFVFLLYHGHMGF